MNKKVILSIMILVFVIGGVVYYVSNKPINNYTTTSGYITKKTQEMINKKNELIIETIAFVPFTDANSGIERKKILVQKKEIWDSIQEGKAYFLCYEWQNDKIPILRQISLNEQFMNLYDENLNPKK